MLSAYKVTSRFLWGAVIADPKETLHKFQTLVDEFCALEEFAQKELKKIQDLVSGSDPKINQQLTYELRETSRQRFIIEINTPLHYRKAQGTAQTLFWAILQQYQLPPQLQKSVEVASRFWSKTRLPKLRVKSLRGTYYEQIEKLEAYLKLCFEIRKQVTNAQAAIAKGKLHADPEIAAKTKTRVGSFTLVNTGGFEDSVMAKAADVVEKAEKAMRGIDQGRVCFGDILISKTINNKRTVAAFYLTSSDEMFIRANTPTNWDTLQTVCHELAHRLQDKFLQSKKAEIINVYRTIKGQQFLSSSIPDEYLPEQGEELFAGGGKLKVTEVRPYKQQIKFVKEGDPPHIAYSTSLRYWLKMKGIEPHQIQDFKGFITKYAEINPEENFCEMVAHYALGKLPVSQVDLLKPILS